MANTKDSLNASNWNLNMSNCAASIAMGEAALSHVMNAEGEKLQKALSFPNITPNELIQANASIVGLIKQISSIQTLMLEKLNLCVTSVNDNGPIQTPQEFRFSIDTTKGVSDEAFGQNGRNLILQIGSHPDNNFDIDWGDGQKASVKNNDGLKAAVDHTYATDGVYNVTLSSLDGTLPGGILFGLATSDDGENRLTEVLTPLFKQESSSLNRVFAFCENLNKVPEDIFSLNTQAVSFEMAFYNDTSLSGGIPEKMFEKNTQAVDFTSVFLGCDGLSGEIPEGLFKNNLEAESFRWVFTYCSGLTGAIPPTLFSNNTKAKDFRSLFFGCSNLTGSIPEGLFENNLEAESFYGVFSECTSLQGQIPEGLFAKNTLANDFTYLFARCSGLTGEIPEKLFASNTKATSFASAFQECIGLQGSIPEELFITNEEAADFQSVFQNCLNIDDIPRTLLTTNLAVNNLDSAFSFVGVKTATVLPTLWQTFPNADHLAAFRGCENASNWGDVPQDWR